MRIDPHTLDFALPDELVAQEPLPRRDEARLIVINRTSGEIEHKRFKDLVYYLAPGEVLVINKARVNRSRIIGKKKTGGRAEMLLLSATEKPRVWRALLKPSMKVGAELVFDSGFTAVVEGKTPEGEFLVHCSADPAKAMESLGHVPLPPYIKRKPADERSAMDAEYYQTVYASAPGSVAAPTAGLHFTVEQIADLKRHGVIVVEMVLHVGWGTFRPIAGSLEEHKMLAESFEISAPAMREIVSARTDRRRIIAVGTTATRALESLPITQEAAALNSATDIFIRPGHKFRWAGALITNLHVPKSTPVSLTAAFASLPHLERAYTEAIQQKYRFYSYGDAMLVI